jgi:hypothetical protein
LAACGQLFIKDFQKKDKNKFKKEIGSSHA